MLDITKIIELASGIKTLRRKLKLKETQLQKLINNNHNLSTMDKATKLIFKVPIPRKKRKKYKMSYYYRRKMSQRRKNWWNSKTTKERQDILNRMNKARGVKILENPT